MFLRDFCPVQRDHIIGIEGREILMLAVASERLQRPLLFGLLATKVVLNGRGFPE